MLAVLLGASAGAVDVIAYLQFDHVFVANMTGNTVLFAAALIASQFSKAVNHLLPIVTFLLGVVTARIAVIRLDRPSWPKISVCLILISGLWSIVAVLIPNLGSILIPVLAFSMGAQNATLPQVEKVPVNTAFITGNLEKLGEAIARLLGKSANRDDRLKMWAVGSIWIAYALGAAAGALAALHIGRRALLLPAGVLCFCAALIFATSFRQDQMSSIEPKIRT
ncbi:MAG TPA: YoaK family protein [Chthoniobacterales bacterium]